MTFHDMQACTHARTHVSNVQHLLYAPCTLRCRLDYDDDDNNNNNNNTYIHTYVHTAPIQYYCTSSAFHRVMCG